MVEGDIIQISLTHLKRPGGPLRMRPIEMGGKYFDPIHQPKQYQTPSGKLEYRGRIELDKDTAFSMKFWARKQPEGLKEAMMENINAAAKDGKFGVFVGTTTGEAGVAELDELSKEKLSAYRKLADVMGFKIGPYKYDDNTGNVQAAISNSQK